MAMEPRPLNELLEGMLQEREELRRKQSEQLREARKVHGLSQQAFAAFGGISQSYLSQVENGQKTISTETLADMTQAFAALPTTGGTNAPSTSTAKEDAAKARKRTA